VPSAMNLIIPNTIGKRYGVIKKTISCLLQSLLQRKASLVLMFSNVSTVKATIKQTTILVHIGETVLIEISMVENNRNSAKVEYSNIAILLVLV